MFLHDGQLDTLRLLRKLASYEADEGGMSSVQDFDTTRHVSLAKLVNLGKRLNSLKFRGTERQIHCNMQDIHRHFFG
jgi:hypothetical protein